MRPTRLLPSTLLLALALHSPTPALAQNCGGPVLMPQLAAGDRYGTSVAWEGQVALVGAPGSDLAAADAGAVHVLDNMMLGYFAPAARLLPPSAVAGEGFGSAVALDGSRLVGGAPGAAGGRAHVFELVGGAWTAMQTVVASDGAPGDGFGTDVALSGAWLAVGAPTSAGGGAVYVFELVGGSWIERQKLVDPAPHAGARFGASCALDGPRLVAGAPNHGHAGADSGRAFAYGLAGSAWTLSDTLDAADASAGQLFGTALALAGDLAAIGAPGDDETGPGAGAVYAFLDQAGTWSQDAKLLGGQYAAAGDAIGSAIDADLNTGFYHLAAGAPGADFGGGSDRGAVVRYVRMNGTWSLAIWAGDPDGVSGDRWGAAVAVQPWLMALGASWRHASVGPEGGSAKGDGYFPDCFGNESFCAGTGSGTGCPCGNGGLPADGCENSGGHGATLISWGLASLANDTLAFGAWNLPPGQPALLFVGSAGLGGGIPFGDGLRCVGQEVVRLGVETADSTGYAEWGPGLTNATGSPPYGDRFFQAWYRDPGGGPCGTGFNLSNGWYRHVEP